MNIEQHDGVALLRMQTGKANAMSASFLNALDQALDELYRKKTGAVVLTGYEKHFSAGLNLLELWEYDRSQLTQFLERFSSVFLKLMRLPQVMIAAINGNAIAGGAILAQTADYRLMARGDFRIGVNEINVGLPFPRQVLEILRERLPRASHFDAFYRGLLYAPDEAQKVGFIDEVCAPNELEARAMAIAQELAGKDREALARIKHGYTAFHIERLEMLSRLGDSEFIDIWFSDECRARMGAIVESLKAKKK